MATHSSILAWEIPLTEEPGGLHSPRARKEPETPWRLHTNKDGDVQNRHTDVRCGRGKSGDQGWDIHPTTNKDGPDIPGSYAILLFTASDLASITSHIHSWVFFLLWRHPFILSGVISPLISSSILGTYWLGEFVFQYSIILPFHTVHGVLRAKILVCHSLLQWITFCQIRNPSEEMEWPYHGQQKSPKCSTWMQSQKRQNDLCSFPRQTIQYHSNPSLFPQPVTLKKLKLNGSMKTYKTF